MPHAVMGRHVFAAEWLRSLVCGYVEGAVLCFVASEAQMFIAGATYDARQGFALAGRAASCNHSQPAASFSCKLHRNTL